MRCRTADSGRIQSIDGVRYTHDRRAAGGYIEKMEFRNSARGHLIALESKSAIGYYLEGIIKDTNTMQNAYGTLASSELNPELVGHIVSLPWRPVLLRHFEKSMRTTSDVHVLIAIPYVRNEVQLRLTWCLAGPNRGEYDSEERKSSRDEKVFFMTALRDLMTNEEAVKACA